MGHKNKSQWVLDNERDAFGWDACKSVDVNVDGKGFYLFSQRNY